MPSTSLVGMCLTYAHITARGQEPRTFAPASPATAQVHVCRGFSEALRRVQAVVCVSQKRLAEVAADRRGTVAATPGKVVLQEVGRILAKHQSGMYVSHTRTHHGTTIHNTVLSN